MPIAWKMKFALSCAALAAPLAVPAAHANSAAVDYFRGRADRSAVPALLSQDERDFLSGRCSPAIDRKDWAQVRLLFANKPDGPLHETAKAEFYLASGSPRIELAELDQWLNKNRELPAAEQIAQLALRRGAQNLPSLPYTQTLNSLPSLPKRILPRDSGDGTMPGSIASAILARIKADDPMRRAAIARRDRFPAQRRSPRRMAPARRLELLYRERQCLSLYHGPAGRSGQRALGGRRLVDGGPRRLAAERLHWRG